MNSSPSSVVDSLGSLVKGAVGIAAENAMLKSQVSQLQKANEAARVRKQRVRKLTKHTTSMSV